MPDEGVTTGFLQRLPPEDAEQLRAMTRVRRFRRGATLMHAGQVGSEVMVLVAGRVKITYTTSEGRDVVLGFRGPGDLIGELAVMDGHPRSSNVEALEPVEALTIAAGDFQAFVAARSEVAIELVRMLSRRFRDVELKRIEFAASQTLGRVAARLVELAEHYGRPTDEGIAIDLRLTQEELAGWSGSSREAVAKALQTLRDLRLIVTGRRRVTILDLERLRRQSG